MENSTNLISARHLTKRFGSGEAQQTIINDLDLDIRRGDFTVIMGASGAGKSTLLYALSGMDKPTSGSIAFCGEDITRYDADRLAVFRRKHCGFVFQQIYLIDKMSLMDNALTAGLLVGGKKKDVVRRAAGLFDQVKLPEVTRRKFPSQISGGEAQRAGIVRAVINRPEVLFADEPTGALNSSHSDAVLDVFSGLSDGGQSIIMVTHDKKSALRGNRVIYLRDGRIFGECDLGRYTPGDAARADKLNAFLTDMNW
ncbi:MAG: ABC transporter ATP-binding protein [Clostridia bacterium]|jgi:putative ABC transport system ATP-binding protein|nr:ABC transporter ATP-binding protein [Clostridia bacterium]